MFELASEQDRITNELGKERFCGNFSLESYYDKETVRIVPISWDSGNRSKFDELAKTLRPIELKLLESYHRYPNSPAIPEFREVLAKVTRDNIFPLLPEELQRRINEWLIQNKYDPNSMRISFNAVDRKGNPLPEHIGVYAEKKQEK